jgi:zinc D-Ala-D-Ala carboxypeptidase
MQLSAHFSLAEFTASATAARHGIRNDVPADLMPNALATTAMLERIRARLSLLAGRPVPLLLSSGYRGLQVNRLVGSADTSDHVHARAADWTAPLFGTPYQVCVALAPLVGELGIGQLIHEYGQWVHTSTRMPARSANRIITITQAGTAVGIQEA